METKKRSILKLDIAKSDKGIFISDLFKLLISTDQTANQIKSKKSYTHNLNKMNLFQYQELKHL